MTVLRGASEFFVDQIKESCLDGKKERNRGECKAFPCICPHTVKHKTSASKGNRTIWVSQIPSADVQFPTAL